MIEYVDLVVAHYARLERKKTMVFRKLFSTKRFQKSGFHYKAFLHIIRRVK